MKQILIPLILLFFIVGCGYKPASYEARKLLKQRIFIESSMNLKDLENSIIIKDALNDAVFSRFGSNIASRDDAEVIISVFLNDIEFRNLLSDRDGYSVAYRAVARLDFEIKDRDNKILEKFSTNGNYDFSTEANSIISDKNRFEAIKEASLKALNEFISKASVKGYLK